LRRILKFGPERNRFPRGSSITANRTETLLQALERHLAERPDSAFCHFWAGAIREDISFRKLRLEAAAYSALYRESGLKAGDVVLIMLQHSPEMYYSFIGAMLCGCIPSMMPFPSPKQDSFKFWESHRELFKRIGAGAILTYPENADCLRKNMPGQPLKILVSEQCSLVSHEPIMAALDAVALIQHSSGTTGLKKGVQLSYGAIAAQIASYSETLKFAPSDSIVSWLPLYHDMGLIACFLLPLTLGLPVVSIDAFEWVNRPALLLEAIQAHGCTHVWLPNFAFHHLCRAVDPERGYLLDSMKAFINCSEPCKPETFDLFLATFGRCGVHAGQLQACYAMAETVFAVTQTAPGRKTKEYCVDAEALIDQHRATPAQAGKPSRRILSTGAVIPGLEIRIDGPVGEIEVRGDFLFSGYYKNEIATSQAFSEGWYKTGDTGFIHDGELYILGRLKEMIIVCGKNLYANDLEYICNRVDGVKKGRCVVFGLFDPEVGTENLIVIAETEIPEGPDWAAIRKNIKSELLNAFNIPPHDVRIVNPGWLIKSTSGKISRGENLQKYLIGKRSEKQGAYIV
jgi:fatty-acyl-CoA synthase